MVGLSESWVVGRGGRVAVGGCVAVGGRVKRSGSRCRPAHEQGGAHEHACVRACVPACPTTPLLIHRATLPRRAPAPPCNPQLHRAAAPSELGASNLVASTHAACRCGHAGVE
jgi:hypothetical protein